MIPAQKTKTKNKTDAANLSRNIDFSIIGTHHDIQAKIKSRLEINLD